MSRIDRGFYGAFFRPPTFIRDGVEYPVREGVELVGIDIEDDPVEEVTRLTGGAGPGGGGGSLAVTLTSSGAAQGGLDSSPGIGGQAIPSSLVETILTSWGSGSWSDGVTFDGSAFTVPADGLYLVCCTGQWSNPNGVGKRTLRVGSSTSNHSSVDIQEAADAVSQTSTVAFVASFLEGESVYAAATQTSGEESEFTGTSFSLTKLKVDVAGGGGGGGGGSPGGAAGNVQFHAADDTLGGSPSFEIDPDDGIAMRFRGVVRHPSTDLVGGSVRPKPFGVPNGNTSFTDTGRGAVHWLPFGFSTFNGSGLVEIDCISGRHEGTIELFAVGTTAAGARTVLRWLRPYSCSAGGVLTLGALIDESPAGLVSSDPLLVLGLGTDNAGGDGIPYWQLFDAGSATADVWWQGRIILTMTRLPP